MNANRPKDCKIFVVFFLICFCTAPAIPAATLQGDIYFAEDDANKRAEVVLRKGRNAISRVSSIDQRYKFENLPNGEYKVEVMVGNHRVTEPVHLCCGTESISVINLNLDRTSPGIHIQFPVESSDVVDVRELQENYSKEIRKEFDKALQNIEMGHLGKAADRLRKVVKSAPDFYRARVMLGMVYHRAGCYLDAEREYLKAREISPQSTSSMINLGSLYIQIASTRLVENRNFTKEAIDLFNQAIPIKPRAALPYFLIGAAYYEDKSFGPAIEHLNGSLEKLNSVPEAHLLLADIYKQQEKWKEALEHLDAYLEENEYSGNQPEIKNLRKEILARLKSEK